MLWKNKEPEKVFTPRASDVNESMYVNRPDLESALKRGLRSSMHLLIYGESGSGKTWLYKRVLKDLDIDVYIANLANASRLKSINAEFSNLVNREQQARETGYSEMTKAGVSAGVASGGLQHQSQYTFGEMEPFEACLSSIRNRSNNKQAILVLDNLESIRAEQNLLTDLANVITLLDDERYASYKVNLLIVGVPGDLRQYYQATPNLTTVANRIREMPEVSRMTLEQCKNLIYQGFIKELKYDVDDIDSIISHISWVTDRLPQRIHEYCLELAFIGESNSRKINRSLLDEADKFWLKQSLAANYTVIESMMNERDTKVGRRNQTLYSLGLIETEEFKWSDIEEIVRKEFPTSTDNLTLNLPQILSWLSVRENPIIKRSPKGDAYCFSDPKYRMCLRAMLRKSSNLDSSHSVEKLSISQI
ncbi:AAA family ATPase [Scytonema sp. NUACC26]|uniref:AAA family ATPase n=1 Tax=Scytonema sp. NUACC26 TaxID=3140176 RepID=UPI0034DC1383